MTSTALAPAAIVSRAGQSETITLAGVTVTFKVTSEQTGGAWALVEYTAPAHFQGPPPHRHAELTETFYVLRGALTLTLGGETVRATAGTSVVVAPGVLHSFGNPDDEPVTFLLMPSPGSHEGFLRELFDLIVSTGEWPPKDPTALLALGARWDTQYEIT